MVEQSCVYCGKSFQNNKTNKKFCSEECRHAYWKRQYHIDPEFRRHVTELTKSYWWTRPHIRWANATIHSHVKRGFNIQFTREALSTFSRAITTCCYCGAELNYKGGNGKKGGFNSNSASLDVKNPDIINKREGKRVFFDDIQIICMRCNCAKSNMSEIEFFTWILKLYKRMNQK
jgi:hypothetical protein